MFKTQLPPGWVVPVTSSWRPWHRYLRGSEAQTSDEKILTAQEHRAFLYQVVYFVAQRCLHREAGRGGGDARQLEKSLWTLGEDGQRAVLGSSLLSRLWLSVTPGTAARQAPLSMGFSRQGYWSGWPCPPAGGDR